MALPISIASLPPLSNAISLNKSHIPIEGQSRLLSNTMMPLSSPTPKEELDAFDFDVSILPNIIDDHGHLKDDPASKNSNDPVGIHAMGPSSPFMLGDYSEKQHFLPSSSVIRNEVLEGVPLCGVLRNDNTGEALGTKSLIDCDGVAFQCAYCKYAKDRAEMAVIHPRNLMAIRESFIRFEQVHVQKCKYIPRDIRECYNDFKARESSTVEMDADGQFLWVSSGIRMGLRDRPEGGILYCPELSDRQELESTWQHEDDLFEPDLYVHHPKQGNIVKQRPTYQKLNNIEFPHQNDVLIGPGRHGNKRPGNKHWHELMREVKSDYEARPTNEKSSLVRTVVDGVRNRSPPGRFLTRDKVTGLWNDIGDNGAMNKTSQALLRGIDNNHSLKINMEANTVKKERVEVVKVPAKPVMVSKAKVNQVVKPKIFKPDKSSLAKGQMESRKHRKLETSKVLANGPVMASKAKVNQGAKPKMFKPANIPNKRAIAQIDTVQSHHLPAPKKQKVESKAPVSTICVNEVTSYIPQTTQVKLEKKLAATPTTSILQKNCKPLQKIEFNNVFDKSFALEKISNESPRSLAGYFGVSQAKGGKYDARFRHESQEYRLGSYILRVDAALAYDAAVRASGAKKRQKVNINFAKEQEYMAARELELNERKRELNKKDLVVDDLADTLEYITLKVNGASLKIRERVLKE